MYDCCGQGLRATHSAKLLRLGLCLALSTAPLFLSAGAFPAIAGAAEDARSAFSKKDYVTALQLWTSLANSGDPEAQTDIGWMYARGLGVPKDDAAALRWFRLAADKGYAKAQYALGIFYADGRAVEKNDKEAFTWYRRAAGQGYANAQNAVGFFYANGRAVEKSDSEAINWYRKAAEQGNATAQANLGKRYMSGSGIGKDYGQGLLWLERAAQQGDVRAKMRLGTAYERGEGVKKDLGKAVSLYDDALERLARAPDESLKTSALAARDRAMKELRASAQPSAPRVPPSRAVRAPSFSANCESGLAIDTVTDDGHIIKLDDGSIWEVDPVDWVTSSLWTPSDDVVACAGKLVNTDEGESVQAIRLK